MKPMAARRHELLSDIADVVARTITQFGDVEDSIIEQVGAAIADALAEHWAGQNIYFALDQGYVLAIRDKAILDAHMAGKTVAEISHQYNLSEQWVRKLIKRMSVRDPDFPQSSLFNE